VRPATSRNRDSGPACDTQALRHEERSPSTVVSRARQPGSNARQTPLVLPRPGTGTKRTNPSRSARGRDTLATVRTAIKICPVMARSRRHLYHRE
jgi:hypothetical protein